MNRNICDAIRSGNDILLVGSADRVAETVHQAVDPARPFRSPHHSCTLASLVGGGKPVAPGEVALAHGGVLYIEDVQCWSARSLQALRAVHDDGEVVIVRVEGIYVFPASFQLVVHANSCPCGRFGDPQHDCTCSPFRIGAYQRQLDGIRRQFGIDGERVYSVI